MHFSFLFIFFLGATCIFSLLRTSQFQVAVLQQSHFNFSWSFLCVYISIYILFFYNFIIVVFSNSVECKLTHKGNSSTHERCSLPKKKKHSWKMYKNNYDFNAQTKLVGEWLFSLLFCLEPITSKVLTRITIFLLEDMYAKHEF